MGCCSEVQQEVRMGEGGLARALRLTTFAQMLCTLQSPETLGETAADE